VSCARTTASEPPRREICDRAGRARHHGPSFGEIDRIGLRALRRVFIFWSRDRGER
jgi:hypothetical protein